MEECNRCEKEVEELSTVSFGYDNSAELCDTCKEGWSIAVRHFIKLDHTWGDLSKHFMNRELGVDDVQAN